MTDGTALREIAAEILTEILEKGQYTHLALFQALSKYQYLEKSDRSFLKRIVDGTVEYKIQIDYIINAYSKTKVHKMKPFIRTLLRMSVYQIYYMDRVPDSAACNEAVKLAQKKGGAPCEKTRIFRTFRLCKWCAAFCGAWKRQIDLPG